MWHRVDKEKQTRTTKIEKLGTKAIATIFVLTIKFQSNSQTKLDIQNWSYFPKGEVVGAPKLKAPGTVAWAN